MDSYFILIFVPVIVGIILLFIPEKNKLVSAIITLLTCIFSFIYVFRIFRLDNQLILWKNNLFKTDSSLGEWMTSIENVWTFEIDGLSKLIVLFIGIFSILISMYALTYMTKDKKFPGYYSYYLITLGTSYGAILANHLILFIIFWGITGITLYKLILSPDGEGSNTAKKTLILIGASDSIMILGIAIIWLQTGTFLMNDISLLTDSFTGISAFLCLLIGSFAKAGAFPMHTWIPDYAKYAPASSSAYFPAALDKLIGIYFLVRLSTGLFQLNQWLTLLLMIIGVCTIIFAVMMALVQHNYKRLLGYHAVSQVGYMVLGIGMGSVIGIAGGIFHMINHALYKSGLFLSAGSIEKQTGEENLDNLGGLSQTMPITFVSALIFALAISGIPPLNGFASKWMIYQALIDFGTGEGIANNLWMIWLALAVIGSALTLASFIKFISGSFLGRKHKIFRHEKEVGILMWIPMVVIAIFCVGIGVFATNYFIPEILMPVTGEFTYIGIWNSTAVSILILLSIVLGIIIYLAGDIKKFRTEDSFVGGEQMQDTAHYSVLDFYKTISDFKLLSFFYKKAEKKWFDVYDLSRGIAVTFNKDLSSAHRGILTNYIFWMIFGLILMFVLLV